MYKSKYIDTQAAAPQFLDQALHLPDGQALAAVQGASLAACGAAAV